MRAGRLRPDRKQLRTSAFVRRDRGAATPELQAPPGLVRQAGPGPTSVLGAAGCLPVPQRAVPGAAAAARPYCLPARHAGSRRPGARCCHRFGSRFGRAGPVCRPPQARLPRPRRKPPHPRGRSGWVSNPRLCCPLRQRRPENGRCQPPAWPHRQEERVLWPAFR